MSERIRVAMVIHDYHPVVGGAERQLRSVAPLLAEQGVDVHVVTRRHAGLAAFDVVDGVPVHRMPIPGPRAVRSLAFTAAALPALRRIRPDVLHAYALTSAFTTALLARRLWGTPLVVKLLRGGAEGDIDRMQRRRSGKRRLAMAARDVDAFMTISREIDAELAAIGVPPERRPFLPNGVDGSRFAPASPAQRAQLRAELGLPDGPIAIFTGRLAPEKRLDLLLEAWRPAHERHPDATLLLVGGGEGEAELRRMAGPGVRFAGSVDDTAPWLRASDVFVLPSATEGLSNALLEAMSSGLPALATAVGGAPDLIEHRASGLLVPPNDAAALREGLAALLADERLRTELAGRGRERVAANYSLDGVAAQLAELYRRLARERGAPSRLRERTSR